MHRHAVFNSLHRGTPLATAIETSNCGRIAWIGVYPLDLGKLATLEFLRSKGVAVASRPGRAYRIRRFEVQRRLIEADISIGESELENQLDMIVFGDDDLLAEIKNFGIDIENLELPYKSDYPI